MSIRLVFLFFCFFRFCVGAMVSDVINLRELPPAYVRVHKVLSAQILQAQADHLLEKSLSGGISIGRFQSVKEAYKYILETGYDNYFSCALSFITNEKEMITIFPGQQCGRVIISRNDDDPILLDTVIETGIAIGDMTGIYSIDGKSFVFISGAKTGSTDYVRTFTGCCPGKDEKILAYTSSLDKRSKDSEKVCFDLLNACDSLDFFVSVLQSVIEDGIVTDIVLNGSSIRSTCHSCLGAIGILQRLGDYTKNGICNGDRAGFFATIYQKLLKINKVDQNCRFSSVISYIMKYEDSKIFLMSSEDFTYWPGDSPMGKIVQLELQEFFFLKPLIEVIKKSMPILLRKLLLEDLTPEQAAAAELLSCFYRQKLQSVMDWLSDRETAVYAPPSNVRIDPNATEMEDLFKEETVTFV